MEKNLAEVLLIKNIIKPDIEVDAFYSIVDIDKIMKRKTIGTFMVKRVHKIEDELFFEVQSVIDGGRLKIQVEDVLRIDGMDPDRLAAVYGVRSDGSIQVAGKKRGRKVKERTKQEIENKKRIIKRKGPRIRIKNQKADI